MLRLFFAFLPFMPHPALATHGTRDMATPMTNAEAALSSLFANPPLPMTNFRQGARKYTVMLDYFGMSSPAANAEGDAPSVVSQNGTHHGFGGAVMFDRAFSERWSVFGSFLGARLAGGTLPGRVSDSLRAQVAAIGQGADTSFQEGRSEMSSSIGIMAGVNRRLVGDSPESFALSAFGGPTIYYTTGKGNATVLNNQATADGALCTETLGT